ncbi:hypothetical protein [Fictibacillus sp. NRS-1165]|uniref:hypothetical protein n=1 Tax=Fictibacillus sp. NRS-1165 TaxID=3144463 RepID=UPI003D21804F
MKIICITVLIFVVLLGFSLGLDILAGFEIHTAIKNALSPFRVMEAPEFFVFFLLIFFLGLNLVLSPLLQKWKQKK